MNPASVTHLATTSQWSIALPLVIWLTASCEGTCESAAQNNHTGLTETRLQYYVGRFNREDEELYTNAIPNARALAFLQKNIPTLECPDADIERTYYFRWWTFRKHLKETPDGFVITEFLPKVSWSGKDNTINCPAGHHFREGRWIHDPKYLADYSVFWFRRGGNPRAYSFWAADSIYQRALVLGDFSQAIELLPDLVTNYREWEKSRLCADGLFWQIDDRDGMEVSLGGSGKRPTINSYMYGEARAIAAIARIASNRSWEKEFTAKAERLRQLVEEKLWSTRDHFYKTLPRSKYEMVTPRDSEDSSVTRTLWFDPEHLGTREWFQYTFPTAQTVQAAAVHWFIARVVAPLPASWQISYLDGGAWKPVVARGPYPVERDTFCRVEFEPVTTTALRLEIQSQPNKAAGLHEWQVFSGETNLSNLAKVSQSLKTRQNAARGNVFSTVNDGNGASTEAELVDVRELHAFTPWYFNLPIPGRGHEAAWRQLMDPQGFYAPYGPTTAEQRAPKFTISYAGHACQWNGPSWPFATAVTLTAMANVLNDYPQDAISATDYLDLLRIYARSQTRQREDGTVVCWIDENLNPFTGDWIARTMLNRQREQKGNAWKEPRERGKDYNHSTFCDLVITGLMGLRPREDDVVVVHPLIPEGTWDWCRIENILYHGHRLTIQWDRDGNKFSNGAGLRVFADGRLIAQSERLERLKAPLGGTGR